MIIFTPSSSSIPNLQLKEPNPEAKRNLPTQTQPELKQKMHLFLTALLLLLVPIFAQSPEQTNIRADPGRPCGFKIAPCPNGSTCSASDPACPATRGENCLGRCLTATTVTLPRPSQPTRPAMPIPTDDDSCSGQVDTTGRPQPPVRTRTRQPPPSPPTRTDRPTPKPTPTRSYEACGGFRPTPKSCPPAQVCVDDPYAGGCGMACDMPGICVEPTFCGGIGNIKCPDGKMCVWDNRSDCNPMKGGRDCGGICV